MDMIRSARLTKRARGRGKKDFLENILPPYLDYVKEKRQQDLSKLSTSELIEELDSRITRVLDEFGKESLKPGFFGGVALGALEGLLVQLMGEEKGVQLSRTLVMALEEDTTIEQNIMLHRVAGGEISMDEFLERFGHRTIGEMELSEPRWHEDSGFLHNTVSSLNTPGMRSPEEIHKENTVRRKEAEEALKTILPEYGGASFREEIVENMKEAQELLPYRETAKHYLMMGYDLVRRAIRELDRRWKTGGDVFFLRLDELQKFETETDTLRQKISERKKFRSAARTLSPAEVIASDDLDKLGLPEEFEAASELKGDPVAAGAAEGPAAVVFDPRQAGDPGAGYILVCPSTDPGWTSLFVRAAGLVVERGGALSHGAIVARDFGIPAVVCPNATARIKNGERIRVDGNRGTIVICDNAEKSESA